MKYSATFSLLSTAGLTVLAILMAVPDASAQGTLPPPLKFQLPAGFQIPPADLPCILPGERLNLQCIIANDPDAKRIRAEEAMLEAQALVAAKSGKLDPYHQVETLGKLEIFDPNLSVNKNVACSYCHDPAAGYANRNPQRYVYTSYTPPLHFNASQADFYGGNFWDGRATGYKLQNSAAEQGQDPPVDPEEMANPDTACVVWKRSQGNYRFFFEQVGGTGSLEITWPANVKTVCSTPKGAASLGGSATPLTLSPSDRTRAQQAFDEFAQAIASYEIGSNVSPFTSKFDGYLAGSNSLTAQELRGYELFRGQGTCNTCHLDGRSNTATGTDTGAATSVQPMFTDFTYNNIGLPKNTILPWYAENFPDQWGFTGNPLGIGFIDEGVGLFLDGYYGAPPNLTWGENLPFFEGKFQTSTARNVGKVPYAGFVKAYMHNGYLLSLKEVVHFYNTRDAYPGAFVNGECRPGTVEKVNCWPPPEDPNNENMTIGKLGLTSAEENDLVAFLETLTDGFVPTPSPTSTPASTVRKPATPPRRSIVFVSALLL